ncbi:unnamed protein product [Owenia fusiformis]|uniref:Uncharacterized protein n=1 Tax=Owenia fusiformis TaxID=6347 RepID=A0A8J1TYP0_OWEFU|nr:unnamed protein product [Owenia fusiformis]
MEKIMKRRIQIAGVIVVSVVIVVNVFFLFYRLPEKKEETKQFQVMKFNMGDIDRAPEGKLKSIIIFGNGPSLRGFDFNALKKYPRIDTLGMNLAFRYWQKINWWPTYYANFDVVVGRDHKTEIVDLIKNARKHKMKKFFLRDAKLNQMEELKNNRLLDFLEDRRRQKGTHILKNINMISTGAIAVRYALFYGYNHILLLGIDMNYVEMIKEAESVKGIVLKINETPKNNPNYFFDGYQQKGDLYNKPNTDTAHVASFNELLRDWKGRTGNKTIHAAIYNGNPKSKLAEIGYPYLSYDDFVAQCDMRTY